jgi:hypothetical protein
MSSHLKFEPVETYRIEKDNFSSLISKKHLQIPTFTSYTTRERI